MNCNKFEFQLFKTGQQGIQGEKGEKGEKGEQGIQGLKGERGEQGIQGLKGERGEQGIQGLKGDKGDRGEQGIQGLKGDKGDKGSKGDRGLQGFSINPKPPITSYTNIFDTDVNDFYYNATNGHAYISKLAYTHPTEPITVFDERYFLDLGKIQGDKGEKGDRGEKGVKGDKGDRGLPGNDAVIPSNLSVNKLSCNSLGNGNSIRMNSSLDGNGKNLGYSGSKFNQLSALAVWGDTGAVSDIKHKKNIRYFDDNKKLKVMSIDNEVQVTKEEIYKFVTNMKLCQYNYTDEYSPSKVFYNKVGFIANDVVGDKVGKLFVEEHEGSLAYNTNNLLFMLLATVQEQNNKILELEKIVYNK